MHKVDIVIPTYNYGRFLDACLHSVVEQSWDDFRVLVIDNASEDNTEDVVQAWLKLDKRITYVRNPVNIGIPGSLFKAHTLTSAPYKMTLCADDLLFPQFLEKIVKEGLEKHPECALGYALTERVTEHGRVPDMYQYVPKLATGIHDIHYHLCITNWILLSFGVYRRQRFDEMAVYPRFRHKFYEGSPRTGSLIDHYQWLLLTSKWPAFVVNERLAAYREHITNDTNTMGKATLIEEVLIQNPYAASPQ